MKRIISLLLASLMILGLVSCKKESADIIYERIRENTLALEYIKLSLSVDSTVKTGDSTLTIPTDSDVKIIRQNGELSYLSTSIVRFMVEDKMARVTLQHYYDGGILYQSAGDVKMKHEISEEKFWEGNVSAETIILKLPSDLLANAEVETKKKVSTFEVIIPSEKISSDLKTQLDRIAKLYSEAKYDDGKYSYGDLEVAVTTTSDGFIAACAMLFTTSGSVSGVATTETILLSYEVVNPGSYFGMQPPFPAGQYEDGEFSIK